MPYKDKEKRNEYARNRARRVRSEFLSDKSCVVCGSTENLEVDHIDPATKVSHRIWQWSEERRNAELAKCQVLCRKHHQEKTIAAMPKKYEHGTAKEYKCGCRCDACRLNWNTKKNINQKIRLSRNRSSE